MMTGMERLIEKLITEKGSIVSTASLDEEDIAQARASERIYVDENGYGFVWIPDMWFPETPEEVEQFEKYYPLPSSRPMPESLNPGIMWDKLKKREEEERKISQN